MSAFSRPVSSLGIPEAICKPLREIARRNWIVVAAVGTLQTLTFALIALLLGALLLGYFEGMPRTLRIPVAFATWGAVLWIGVRFLRPTLRRWSLSRAALHVEQSLPGIHERLSSAVELADERDDRFRGSPRCCASASTGRAGCRGDRSRNDHSYRPRYTLGNGSRACPDHLAALRRCCILCRSRRDFIGCSIPWASDCPRHCRRLPSIQAM